MSRAQIRLRRVALIAGQDLLDLGRQRGTWLSLLMLPVINVVLIVLLPGFLTEREQSRQETAVFVVAAEGDTDARRYLERTILGRRFRVEPAEDAAAEVRSRQADVGVVLEPTARRALEGDASTTIRVVALSTRRQSNVAFAQVLDALEKFNAEAAEGRAKRAGLPRRAVQPFAVDSTDIADSYRGARLELSRILPLLVLLPLTGAVGLAAQRISGSKDRRVIEPLLVLPIGRVEVLAGKAISGLALGAVMIPAVIVPLLVGRVAPVGGAGRTVALPAMTLLGIGVVATALLALLVAIGALAGSAARTSTELSSLLPFATFPMMLLALSLRFFPDVHAEGPLAAVPVLGPALLTRDIAAGTARPSAAIIVVATTLAWALAVLVPASRFLERDRSVLRSTG